jgi:hypothetical protein
MKLGFWWLWLWGLSVTLHVYEPSLSGVVAIVLLTGGCLIVSLKESA